MSSFYKEYKAAIPKRRYKYTMLFKKYLWDKLDTRWWGRYMPLRIYIVKIYRQMNHHELYWLGRLDK